MWGGSPYVGGGSPHVGGVPACVGGLPECGLVLVLVSGLHSWPECLGGFPGPARLCACNHDPVHPSGNA